MATFRMGYRLARNWEGRLGEIPRMDRPWKTGGSRGEAFWAVTCALPPVEIVGCRRLTLATCGPSAPFLFLPGGCLSFGTSFGNGSLVWRRQWTASDQRSPRPHRRATMSNTSGWNPSRFRCMRLQRTASGAYTGRLLPIRWICNFCSSIFTVHD